MRFIIRLVFLLLFLVVSLIIVILYKAYNNINKNGIEGDPILQILANTNIEKILPETDIKSSYGLKNTFVFNRYDREAISKSASISNELAIIIVIFVLIILLVFMGICCVVIISLTSDNENKVTTQNRRTSQKIYDKEMCFEKTKMFLDNFKNDFEEEFLPDYTFHSYKAYTGFN